jgi:hypothetical protein
MNDQERAELREEIAERARAIDPATFSAYWTYGSIMDPYGTGYEGEGCVGRVWWIYDSAGLSVTAWDFLSAHPEVDWDSIYAHEDEWSRSGPDPLRGVPGVFRPLSGHGRQAGLVAYWPQTRTQSGPSAIDASVREGGASAPPDPVGLDEIVAWLLGLRDLGPVCVAEPWKPSRPCRCSHPIPLADKSYGAVWVRCVLCGRDVH